MISAIMIKQIRESVESIRRLTAELHQAAGIIQSTEYFQSHGQVYRPKRLEPYEVLPPEIYEGEGEKGLRYLDNRILWTSDAIYDYFDQEPYRSEYPFPGPRRRVWCNNWKWGGRFRYRGFNPPWVHRKAKLSQHFMGRALDLTYENLPAEIIRKVIKAKPTEPAFQFIRAIEEDVSWLHIDTRNTLQEEVLLIKP